MIPRQSGPEPKARSVCEGCEMYKELWHGVQYNTDTPIECERVDGAARRDGYDIETGSLDSVE